MDERIRNAIVKLPIVARDLNRVSDELNVAVEQLNQALKRFNFGVPVWAPIDETASLGYVKTGGKWGLAIKDTKTHLEIWQFHEAPRLLRVQAIDKIPDLLEELLKTAQEMTRVIVEKTAEIEVHTQSIEHPEENRDKPKLVG